MALSDDLLAAYRHTRYTVNLPGGGRTIRIGERHAWLDELLRARGHSEWAYITAHNPRSRPVNAAENAARHSRLVDRLAARWPDRFEGAGIGDDATWPAETSVLVLGISPPEARGIAREFDQNAIVAGKRGGAAELVVCDAAEGA